MTDKFKKLQQLTDRIAKMRNLLGDQDSPPHLIVRPKHHPRSVHKRRVAALQKLEVQQLRLVKESMQSDTPGPVDTDPG